MIKKLLLNNAKIECDIKEGNRSLRSLSQEELVQTLCAREIKLLCNKIGECFNNSITALMKLNILNDKTRNVIFDVIADLDDYRFDIIKMLTDTSEELK